MDSLQRLVKCVNIADNYKDDDPKEAARWYFYAIKEAAAVSVACADELERAHWRVSEQRKGGA